ncbi:MAG: MotA/TolQ/ExbB proton channel family protein [Elusimicrobia bacterium]|nr:MotA/TolQ/ExbB proton channel family protein [Elusimicrobiota bacterium]
MALFYRWKAYFLSGGFTLLPLLLLSMYSLALVWERYAFYTRSIAGLPRFLDALRSMLSAGELKDALAHCKQYTGMASSVVQAALVGPVGKDERMNAVERAIGRQTALLEERLAALGTIGSIAPFIGLFGTVLGVMRAFKDLAHATGAGPGVVAVGISEALIATAAGIFVAIPAIVAYNYFTTKANRFADEMRWVTEEILDRLTQT